MMKKIITLILMLFALTSCFEKEYSGTLDYSQGACDEEFGISVDAPILIREVEMVQYYKGDNGVRMILANYPIESFEYNGNTYENPPFNTDLKNKVFYSNVTINGIELSDELIYAIVNSDVVNPIKLTELNEEKGTQHGLVIIDDSYVTASDDWNLGDIKITYYYLEPSSICTIKAKLKDDTLIYNKNFEVRIVH